MKTTYIYPAVFEPEKEGGYSVYFPDIPGCYTDGANLEEAMNMAEDALCLMLYHLEEEHQNIPKASDIQAVKAEAGDQNFVSFVKCDTLNYRKFYRNKTVRKSLTIPGWLNDLAEAEHVNFSNVLQNALANQLGVTL